MNQKQEIKNHMIKIGIFVFAIILLGVSASYAYYTANISGQAEINKKNAAQFDLNSTLNDSAKINNPKLELLDDTQKIAKAEKITFSVTNENTSTVNGKYFVYLTDIKLSKNLYSEYFKWELVRITGDTESVMYSGTFADAIREDNATENEDFNVKTTTKEITLNSVALQITPGTTDNLLFRIWLQDDPNVNQVNLTNGSFEGRLRIEGTPVK